MSEVRDAAPGAGVLFGRYLIRKRLGHGGMGEVFLAEQVGPLGPVRPVALKRMLPQLAADAGALRMFFEEMRTAAQLSHPNIATTYDFGEIDGVYFLALEYVEGVTLNALMRGAGPLPIPDALQIARTISEALSHAHTLSGPSHLGPVVHSDVSPQNIMISRQGAVKLLDFGIAKTEAAVRGELRAKISYAAPEQLRGAPTDRRFDLWALGVVLYEMLTAVRPFEADGPEEIVAAAERRRYRPLSLVRPEAAAIDPLIALALEPDATRRWNSAEAFGQAIAKLQQAHPPVHPERLARLCRRAAESTADDQAYDVTATDVTPDKKEVPRAIQSARKAELEHRAEVAGPSGDRYRLARRAGREAEPEHRAEVAGPSGDRYRLSGKIAGVVPPLRAPEPITFTEDREPRQPIEAKPPPSGAGCVAAEAKIDQAIDRADRSRHPLIARLRTWSSSPIGWPGWALLAIAVSAGGALLLTPLLGPARSASMRAVPTPAAAPREAASAPTPPPLPQAGAVARQPEAARSSAAQKAESGPRGSMHVNAARTDRASRREAIRPTATEESKGGFGVLSVRSKPWARVALDGRSLGEGVVAGQPIPAGKHTLTITPGDPDLAPRTFDIDIKVGIITRIVVDFRAGTLRIDPL